MKYNTLSRSIKTALAFGLFAGVGVGPTAFAQDEDVAELDILEITGSRLSRTDIETAQPVTIITREDIDISGDVTVSEVLQTTVFNSFGSFRETSGFANGAAAQNTISLRGLGSQRTLVLLDGRRLSSSGTSGAAAVNLNQIPLDVVDRIEILRDGASAVYGSDAIAGVINIITRKNYEGVTFSVSGESPEAGNPDSSNIGLTMGVSGDRGSMFFTLSSYDRRPQYYRDLPYASNAPDSFGISSFGYPGTFIALSGPAAGGNFVDPRCPLDVGDSAQFPNSYTWDFATFEAGNATFGSNRCAYNFAADIKSVPDVRRNAFFTKATYEVTDNVNINARLMFSESASDTRFAGTPVTGPFPTMSADNPNNPMPAIGFEPVDLLLLVRTVANGTRDNHVDEQFTDMTVGFDGYMDVGRGWDWNVNFQHNRNITTNATQNLVNKNILQQIIDDGTLDFFNVNGNYSEDIQRQANHTGLYEAEIVRQSIDGYIRTELFDMPAGPVSAAFGFEVSNLDFDQLNDPESNAFIIAGSAGGDNVSAGREVRTLFFESLFPLHDMIDLAVAARWDDYSDEGVGSDVSPQVGVTFRPLDNLLVRASYGEGFRAPSMTELFGNQSESFPSGTDLTGCANGVAPCTPTQYRTFFGGNPSLGAEESKSWTVGVVWEPIDALALELSLYHTEFDGQITTSSLNREFQAEFDGFPNFITRAADGTVDFISLQTQNFEGIETEGVDFNAAYSLDTDSAGFFRFTAEVAYVDSYESQTFAESPVLEIAGTMGAPDLRVNAGVQWSYNDFGATIQNHYISSQSEESDFCTGGTCAVGSHNEIDLQVSYALPWDAEVVLGARNLTDEEPELNAEYYGWEPFSFSIYNTLGRVPYVRYTQSF